MLKAPRKIKWNSINKEGRSSFIISAIREILFVMIGILLALSVNNWNESRKKQIKEKALLKQLHEEFQDNKEQLVTVKRGHLAAYYDAESVLKMFPINPNTVNLDSLNFFFFNADNGGAIMDRWTFNPSNAIIKSITNSAAFDLIQNEELRFKLLAWDSILDDYLEDEHIMIAFRNDVFIPYLIEKGVMTQQRFKHAAVSHVRIYSSLTS